MFYNTVIRICLGFNYSSFNKRMCSCVGLTVSALVSGSSGLGSSPDWRHCVMFLTLTVPLSAQVYKWLPANLMLGVTLG